VSARLASQLTALALVVVSSACGGDTGSEPPLREPTLLEIDLRTPFDEREQALFGEPKPSVARALERARRKLDEPLVRGVFVRLGELGGRFADAHDWALLLDAAKAKQKPVHCAFDTLDNAGYALAAHCERLSMTPSGTLDLVGLAAQVMHGRALLDLLGVRAELLQIGQYKGAAEPFTRDSMSEPLRESLEALLDELDASFREHLGARGVLAPEGVQATLDGGPYHAGEALAHNLVDAVAYDDEARHHAKAAAGAKEVRELYPHAEKQAPTLTQLIQALSGKAEDPHAGKPRLVLATLSGEIVDGSAMGPNRMASEPFVDGMRQIADDDTIKAMVLRVESPGGSALASDRMWHAVRRVAKRKPVVVSIGEMAASGGYYVASAGAHIIASPSSIVGSIGVVGGKVVFKDLADRVGVHGETLPRAQHAAWLSPLAPFSDSERARLEALLKDTYHRFVNRVALGRKRTVAQLADAVEGRVMGGKRALMLGLIDEIGGLGRALELGRKRGGLPAEAPFETWPRPSDPISQLSTALGGAHAHAQTPSLSQLTEAAHSDATASWILGVSPGRPAAVLTPHLSVR
jgi:protease-4